MQMHAHKPALSIFFTKTVKWSSFKKTCFTGMFAVNNKRTNQNIVMYNILYFPKFIFDNIPEIKTWYIPHEYVKNYHSLPILNAFIQLW